MQIKKRERIIFRIILWQPENRIFDSKDGKWSNRKIYIMKRALVHYNF